VMKFKPDIIVVANDQGINATFIAIGRLRKIPTLAIQDGILSHTKVRGAIRRVMMWKKYLLWRVFSLLFHNPIILKFSVFFGWPARSMGWGSSGVDRIVVMGNHYKQVFISNGIRPSKIFVTGYPLLDDVLRHSSKFNAEELFEKMGLQRCKPLILLITQPFVEDGLWSRALRDLFVESVVNSVKHVNGQLVIKLHPRENLEVYKMMLANKHRGISIVVTKDFNLHELLLASDIVVTVSSTVGLWALAYRKPLLVMTCLLCTAENVLEDMAITVDNMHELPRTLERILQDEKLKANLLDKAWKTLNDHVYRLDGKASERIARLIFTIAKRKL